MGKSYYKNGVLEVTSDFVKARGRSIQLSTLESVDLSRNIFLAALGIGGGLALFSITFVDLLWWHEIAFALIVGAGLLFAAWQFGTLTFYSKLTGGKGWQILGRVPELREMRSAVEQALSDREKRVSARKRGGAVTDDSDDDDQEDDAG